MTTLDRPVRLVIADDHHLVRSGLRGMLDVHDDLEVVGEAPDGAAVLDVAAELRPDVVVMDIRMPRLDGIEATRRLRQRDGAPHVLVLTTFDLDEYVYEALRAGAGGFMLKDAPPSQLAEAVRTVAAGESLLAPAVTRRLVERYVQRPTPNADQRAGLERQWLHAVRLGFEHPGTGEWLEVESGYPQDLQHALDVISAGYR